MFESPFIKNADTYTFYITYDSIKDLKANSFLVKQKEKYPIALIKNLPLGKNYKWFVETKLKTGKIIKSEFHTFSILNSKLNNKKYFRTVQHYNNKKEILDGIVWCDQYRCAVDRNGKIVWFMADAQNDLTKTKAIRDFKIYKDGSLTLLNYPNAIQSDLSLTNIIWQAPTEGVFGPGEFFGYHHSIERLSNGNYMVLANEKVNFKNENKNDTAYSEAIDFCNIVEFDKNGKIIWKWIMKEHFPYELLVDSRIETASGIVDPHANSFCLDSTGNYLYINFRDISRVIKIDRKTKEIVASYGFKLKDEDEIFETEMFKLQHDIQLLNNNNDFLLFNNNDIKNGKISSVEIVHFPIDKKDSFRSIWKFDLNFDKYNDGKVDRMGGVKILANGNFLICQGSSNRIVEVSPKKKVLWDFAIQQLDSANKVNKFFSVYRSFFSPSLYPSYFGAYFEKNKLTIINKGHEKDIYTIELKDENEKIIKTITSDVISSNQSLNFNLTDYNKSIKTVSVSSHNSKLTKVIDLTFIQP